YVFGVSGTQTDPRRIVFAAKIEERITFKEAYDRFPALRGPHGPIHVRPICGAGPFPDSEYEHIPGAQHCGDGGDWKKDLETRARDAFFICAKPDACCGRWLGPDGPALDKEILTFLRTCSVHGSAGRLSEQNTDAEPNHPIAYGGLYKGLHAE